MLARCDVSPGDLRCAGVSGDVAGAARYCEHVGQPDLSIVVPTRNRADLLDECLHSLLAQTLEATQYEIIVVDNASKDATPSVVQRHISAHSNVRLVHAPVPGVNRARNAGLEAAGSDIVAFVDDDELAPPDYGRRLLEACARRPEAGGVGGPCVEPAATSGRTCGRCSLGGVTVPAHDGWAERLLGGNMALRRATIDAVGPFSPTLSGRGDETEWFERARRAGYRFAYDDALWLQHRRDVFTARAILWAQFRQGRDRPRADREMGRAPTLRPRLVVRSVAHGLRRRCLHGFVIAAREMGAVVGWVGARFRARAERSDDEGQEGRRPGSGAAVRRASGGGAETRADSREPSGEPERSRPGGGRRPPPS